MTINRIMNLKKQQCQDLKLQNLVQKTQTAEKEYRVKIVSDKDGRNTFEDDDCHYPLMFDYGRNEGKDYSDGEIDYFLQYFLSSNQIIYHQKKILAMLENGHAEDLLEDAEDRDYKVNIIQYAICDFICESIENKVKFCEEFKILHYQSESRGYSQGDWANALIVPTRKNAELLGYKLKDVTEENLKSTFKLFEHWAWGDVYGFQIEQRRKFKKTYENGDEMDDEEWEEIDSCYGFYGRDGDENGMIDNISYEEYGFTREQMIALINDAKVEY